MLPTKAEKKTHNTQPTKSQKASVKLIILLLLHYYYSKLIQIRPYAQKPVGYWILLQQAFTGHTPFMSSNH